LKRDKSGRFVKSKSKGGGKKQNYSLYKGIQVTKAESAQLKKLTAKITKLNNTSIHKHFGKKGIDFAGKIGKETYQAKSKLYELEKKIYYKRKKSRR